MGYAAVVSTPSNAAQSSKLTKGSVPQAVVSVNTDQSAQPAVSTSTGAVQPAKPVKAKSQLIVGKAYSMIQLLNLGYAVEAKKFAQGEQVQGAIAKSAIWKVDGGAQEFWQGTVNTDGQFVLTQQISGNNSKTINSSWSGGK